MYIPPPHPTVVTIANYNSPSLTAGLFLAEVTGPSNCAAIRDLFVF